MKQRFEWVIQKLCQGWTIVPMLLPFVLIDIFMRVFGQKVNYFRGEMVFPNLLFVTMWILLFVLFARWMRSGFGRVWYCVWFVIFFLLFLTHAIYFGLTGFFFSFNLLLMAGEGSAYIWDTIKNASPVIFLMCLLILASFAAAMAVFPKREKANGKAIVIAAVVFVVLHLITPQFFGKANEDLAWDTWRNPHNVYNNFNDANKCVKICGIYEYTVRDFYVTFLKRHGAEDKDEIAFLEEQYETLTQNTPNAYTGIFEGKNVIFLQLEGIDDWLLTEETMPNLYGLLKESLEFTNHYSYYNGGGSTFNSELAVNTGLITPITYIQNAYSFHTNRFDHSLANLFADRGYRVNAFHMNTGEYYARRQNYLNWGYEHYYGLKDEHQYEDLSYELDRELIEDEGFYERMFCSGEPFLHYIITYSPHKPFTVTKDMGKYLAGVVYGEDVPQLDEEACARLFAGETDYMIGLMMQALKDNGLYDNTVIVAYADHYLYTIEDKTILDKYKDTSDNHINKTPFFIWSAGGKHETIDKLNGQIDILPTVLNMFGFSYTPEYYIGQDILDDSYEGYVFFCDGSWFDEQTGGDASEQALDAEINRLIKKNDLTLKYDYFRRIPKE